MEWGERYAILYDREDGEYRAAEVGGIRTRTVRAGDALEVECYPLVRVGPAARREAALRRTSAAMERINRRNAEKRIRRYIDQNFTARDWVLTLTWDYGIVDRFTMSQTEAERRWDAAGLPMDVDEARRAWNNYLRRVKGRIRRNGGDPAELMHLYVLESTHEPRPEDPNPLPAHYHFHAVLHAPGVVLEELKALWPWGDVRGDHFSPRSEGAARLAAYMTKQRKVERVERDGRRVRRWGHSKNLAEPAETVSDRKLSRRRAEHVARDVQKNGVEIFERLYPGYRCVEEPVVRFSDFVAGAYIYARLRREDGGEPWERVRRRTGGALGRGDSSPSQRDVST